MSKYTLRAVACSSMVFSCCRFSCCWSLGYPLFAGHELEGLKRTKVSRDGLTIDDWWLMWDLNFNIAKSSLVFCQLYLYAALILLTPNPLAFGCARHDPPKIYAPKTWFSSKSAFECKLIHHPQLQCQWVPWVILEKFTKCECNTWDIQETKWPVIDPPSQILLLVLPWGFLHSYNVVLDSYQWEENFNEWSKLTGSMVYHTIQSKYVLDTQIILWHYVV